VEEEIVARVRVITHYSPAVTQKLRKTLIRLACTRAAVRAQVIQNAKHERHFSDHNVRLNRRTMAVIVM
jgi:hypothetical protein